MLNSKERAYLRGMASTADTLFPIGKDGITENLVAQVDDALRARELIKLRVLETAMLTPREAAAELAEATNSEVVTTIGTKLVLYRPNPSKKDKIVLPKK